MLFVFPGGHKFHFTPHEWRVKKDQLIKHIQNQCFSIFLILLLPSAEKINEYVKRIYL